MKKSSLLVNSVRIFFCYFDRNKMFEVIYCFLDPFFRSTTGKIEHTVEAFVWTRFLRKNQFMLRVKKKGYLIDFVDFIATRGINLIL